MQTSPARDSSHEAAEKLANLIEAETGVEIEPIVLRLFIKSNWSKVSKHSHDIHDQD